MVKHGVTEFLQAFHDLGVAFCDMETDILILLDEQGNIERVYPGFTRALGYTESDVLGYGVLRLVDGRDTAAFVKSFNLLPRPAPFRMFHKDGSEVWVRLEAARFIDKHGFLIIRKMGRAIT